ncbi:hypothetical protein DFH28DRAFT_1121574 [Melampsora americana]|nr:hypothetical protein DFH28DRAFT_1121574 [Melampsora americana]
MTNAYVYVTNCDLGSSEMTHSHARVAIFNDSSEAAENEYPKVNDVKHWPKSAKLDALVNLLRGDPS